MKDCFDPRSYGAVADGHSKDTAAVQAAIDAAAAQGGTVRLAGGTFVCGTLYLKSNVALEITNSATLLASPDIADYGTDTHHNRYRNEPELDRCFLFAQDAENVTICGSGVIDGNAAAFPNAGSIYRPMLLRVLRCRNVRVQNLRLLNAAAWATAFLDSDFIWATDLHIENHRNYNGDGLDFDSCRHVWVRGCYIDGTDDNLCLQSSGLPVQDVHISDCAFTSVCVGIRIGLKSIGEISGVVISNHQAVTKMLSQPFFFVVTPKNGDFDVLFSRSYFTRLSNRFMAVGLFCCRFSTAVRPHCGKNERICR